MHLYMEGGLFVTYIESALRRDYLNTGMNSRNHYIKKIC